MKLVCLVVAVFLASCGKEPHADKVAPASGAVPAAKVAASDDATTKFWAWFSQHAAELRADPDLEKTMETISGELAKVNPGVFAEIGKDGDNRLLVISVDGKKDLFPVVQRIHAARPEVPGWKIVAFRQRSKDFGVEINGKEVKPSSVKFVATPNTDKLDVELFMPAVGDHDQMAQLGFVLLDHAIGEYDMEMKIAGVEFQPIEKAPKDAKPLGELAAAVDATK